MKKFEVRDEEVSGKRGFVLEHDGYDENTSGLSATRQFVPPCSNTTVYKRLAATYHDTCKVMGYI